MFSTVAASNPAHQVRDDCLALEIITVGLIGSMCAVDLSYVPLCRHDHRLKYARGWRLG
jgi:hypothetical protein